MFARAPESFGHSSCWLFVTSTVRPNGTGDVGSSRTWKVLHFGDAQHAWHLRWRLHRRLLSVCEWVCVCTSGQRHHSKSIAICVCTTRLFALHRYCLFSISIKINGCTTTEAMQTVNIDVYGCTHWFCVRTMSAGAARDTDSRSSK